ncbi:hypothetical protein GCM10022215_29700 [Nocardioides fonticola]|uniref:Uncharacterized protein n=1 Tax=Nocardioides fonticola TaxID=450363 RepID=A0ABP7XPC9_9ACTN
MDTLRQGLGWLLLGVLVCSASIALSNTGQTAAILVSSLTGLIGLGLIVFGLGKVLWFLLRPAKRPDA